MITQVLKKPKLVFEERLIVESALNLWVGCLLHRGELLDAFLSNPAEAEAFILAGLLFCPYESVREDFRQSLSALCAAKSQKSALSSILQLLARNFSLISSYPCKQYFELFCELLDKHVLASRTGLAAAANEDVIDSEALLSAVIGRISEENQKAQKARAEGSREAGTAGLLTGLI